MIGTALEYQIRSEQIHILKSDKRRIREFQTGNT